MKHKDYMLIPFNDISEDARKIAVAWFEYKTIGFDLHNRHKLASDIMNYSNIQLEEYKAKLKAAIELIPLEDEEHLIVSKIETLIDLT